MPALGLLLLLSIDIGALRNERGIWRQAANTRDALIAQAEATVRAVPCSTLGVLDAPDNFRGAFVFREGLPEAISDLRYDNDGVACIVRGLAPIEEHTWRTVDALARDERRANQPKQAGILLRAVRQRLLQPA